MQVAQNKKVEQLRKMKLNGIWKMSRADGDMIGEKKFLDAAVPGSLYQTMLENGEMKDPFYGENELEVLKLSEEDFCFETVFRAGKELMQEEKIFLVLDGIDTLADVFVNGENVGHCDNMHRSWEFDVSSIIKDGKNELKIRLYSPIQYIKQKNEKVYTGGVTESMEGFPHLRKAHCMFGWDWGPRLPDEGIFRDVSLVGYSKGRIHDVYVTQKHEDERVGLGFHVNCQWLKEGSDNQIEIKVTAPDGTCYLADTENLLWLEEPQLWWPNGYGAHPLYKVNVTLLDENKEVLDTWEKKIGLRTMTINQDKDEWGNGFAHEVNGVKIFAMGANYIPEDNLLGRCSKERTKALLKDCVTCHYNIIRVWGGGFYPDDYFYELCDEFGLLVWQDFMFACESVELTEEFEENIRQEVIQNVQRIRNHACLALWCGNNEMESQTMDKCWKPSKKQECDYIKLFEYIIPGILKQEDPQTFYWPSSPSSGGNYDNPWEENKGDTHYWDVWHGEKPFTEFRKFYFRYLSEFGFQSFPSLKTIETFTEEKDRNIFSRVMEMHQRNCGANGKILSYLSQTYLYPKDFAHLIYASQLLQAEAMRHGIEHNRRNRGRCMGTIVWQLNDIWPAASWSGIDYYGRWKALQYEEKRSFEPVHISCEEMGEIQQRPYCILEPSEMEQSVRLHVANETKNMVTGTVKWELRTPDSLIVLQGSEEVTVEAMSGTWLDKLNFQNYNVRKHYVSYTLETKNGIISSGTCLLTMPKHFEFRNPKLQVKQDGDKITVTAENYAKNVMVYDLDSDLVLSDNFFDMNKGEKTISIQRGTVSKLRVMSVYDIGF